MLKSVIHNSYEEAKTAVTFPILIPSYIPSGFSFRKVQQVIMGPKDLLPDKVPQWLIGIYLNDKKRGERGSESEFINLAQGYGFPAYIETKYVTSDAHGICDLARGIKAKWVKGQSVIQGPPREGYKWWQDPQVFHWNANATFLVLGWQIDPGSKEENRFARGIRLETNTVSLEELQKMAESFS